MGGYDSSYSEATIREAWDACIEAGVDAVRHGGGLRRRRERAHHRPPAGRRPVGPGQGGHRHQVHAEPVEAGGHLGADHAAAKASLERLGIESIDLYQIHGPISLRSHSALADALAAAHAEGLIKAVGVSNYSVKETQVHRRRAAQTGPASGHQPDRVLAPAHHAREGGPAGVLPGAGRGPAGLLAHRPGPADRQVLGRQPTPEGPRPSRTTRWRRWTRSSTCCAGSARHTAERTPSQVALAWIIAKGAVPIPGAKSRQQAEDNAGALGWRMDDDELAALDAAALYGTRRHLAAALAARLSRRTRRTALARLTWWPERGRSTVDAHDRAAGRRLAAAAAREPAASPPPSTPSPSCMILGAWALYLWGVQRAESAPPPPSLVQASRRRPSSAAWSPPPSPSSASSASTTRSCSGTTWSSTSS